MLGIVMDGPKAMNILGFPTHQTFDNTSQDEISKAFVYKMRMVMKNRKQSKGNKKEKRHR